MIIVFVLAQATIYNVLLVPDHNFSVLFSSGIYLNIVHTSRIYYELFWSLPHLCKNVSANMT
jgi:hypothetical protein